MSKPSKDGSFEPISMNANREKPFLHKHGILNDNV